MKKYRKRICACTALILTVVIVLVSVLGHSEEAYAHETFTNVSDLVNEKIKNNEEFLILEIVDDLEEASIGYLIGGQEPYADRLESMSGEEHRELLQELQERGLLVMDENSDQSAYPLSYEADYRYSNVHDDERMLKEGFWYDGELDENGNAQEVLGYFVAQFQGETGYYCLSGQDAQDGTLTYEEIIEKLIDSYNGKLFTTDDESIAYQFVEDDTAVVPGRVEEYEITVYYYIPQVDENGEPVYGYAGEDSKKGILRLQTTGGRLNLSEVEQKLSETDTAKGVEEQYLFSYFALESADGIKAEPDSENMYEFTKDTSLYAVYEEKTGRFEIKIHPVEGVFDDNGALTGSNEMEGAPDDTSVWTASADNHTITLPAEDEIEGYEFVGYYRQKDDQSFEKVEVTDKYSGNTTIYAVYKPAYVVTVHYGAAAKDQDGSIIGYEYPDEEEYIETLTTKAGKITLPEPRECEGYVFECYSLSQRDTSQKVTDATEYTEDTDIYAVYTRKDEYTVTLYYGVAETNDDGAIDGYQYVGGRTVEIQTQDGKITLPDASAVDSVNGYRFIGFSLTQYDSDNLLKNDHEYTQDTSIYAVYEKNTVAYSDDPDGVTPSAMPSVPSAAPEVTPGTTPEITQTASDSGTSNQLPASTQTPTQSDENQGTSGGGAASGSQSDAADTEESDTSRSGQQTQDASGQNENDSASAVTALSAGAISKAGNMQAVRIDTEHGALLADNSNELRESFINIDTGNDCGDILLASAADVTVTPEVSDTDTWDRDINRIPASVKKYVKATITNQELFKYYVLGLGEDRAKELNIRVITFTVDGNYTGWTNDTEHYMDMADAIEAADLIYVNGDGLDSQNDQTETDISNGNLQKIFSRAAAERTPVILEYALYAGNYTPRNMYRLVCLLLQSDLENAYLDLNSKDLSQVDWNAVKNGVEISNGGNFVRDNIFCVDYKGDSFQKSAYEGENTLHDSGRIFGLANADFASQFTDAVSDGGFAKVYTAIQQENYERGKNQNSETGSGQASMDEYVTPAVSVAYILNFEGYDPIIYKDTIRVLELEPCRDFTYYYDGEDESIRESKTQQFAKDWISYSGEVSQTIIIDGMTTAEFCGKISDIYEQYDVIYWGSNTGLMFNKYADDSSYFTATGDSEFPEDIVLTNTTLEDGTKISALEKYIYRSEDGNWYYTSGTQTSEARYSSYTASSSGPQEEIYNADNTWKWDPSLGQWVEGSMVEKAWVASDTNAAFDGNQDISLQYYVYQGLDDAGNEKWLSLENNEIWKYQVRDKKWYHYTNENSGWVEDSFKYDMYYATSWGGWIVTNTQYNQDFWRWNGTTQCWEKGRFQENVFVTSSTSGKYTQDYTYVDSNKTKWMYNASKGTWYRAEFLGYKVVWSAESRTGFTHNYFTRDNTGIEWKWDGSAQVWMRNVTADAAAFTTYYDSDMNGMVYTHVGDLYYAYGYDGLIRGANEWEVKYRYSGNDILDEQVTELLNFLESGNPIILARDFMAYNEDGTIKGVNSTTGNVGTRSVVSGGTTYQVHGILDSSSYVYQFVKEAYDRGYSNLLIQGMDKPVDFAAALNKPKVELNLLSAPTEYTYTTQNLGITNEWGTQTGTVSAIKQTTYLSKENDGYYYLNYEFTIGNLSAVTPLSTRYHVQLFLDENSDGIYNTRNEELTDIVVMNAQTGEVMSRVSSPLNDGDAPQLHYELSANTPYIVRRVLPEGYVGCVGWKLMVSQVGNTHVHDSATGLTAVPYEIDEGAEIDSSTGKEVIHVLQIINNGGGTLNLEQEAEEKVGQEWELLLSSIPDFTIKFDAIDRIEFANSFKNEGDYYDVRNVTDERGGYLTSWADGTKRNDYLNFYDYDMVIVGFDDKYQNIPSEAAIDALLTYADMGKSLMFTHDTTYHAEGVHSVTDFNDSGNSSTLSMSIRDLCGMDRFGISQHRYDGVENPIDDGVVWDITGSDTISQYILNNRKGSDIAYAPGSGQQQMAAQTQGFTASGMANAITTQQYLNYTTLNNNRLNMTSWMFAQNTGHNARVTQVNKGVITQYPYLIDEEIIVSNTHAQYYQLDLDTDSDGDGYGDVNVWYCISSIEGPRPTADNKNEWDDVYDYSPNDVRNNYYIYNRGNITYTGVGHEGNFTEDEMKLFINTFVAAYNAGIRNPSVRIVEDASVNAADLESVSIPFDDTMADDTYKAYYQVKDNNIASGTKGLSVRYYIGDVSGSDTITYNGAEVRVREISLDTYNAVSQQPVSGNEVLSGNSYCVDVPLQSLAGAAESFDFYVEIDLISEKDGMIAARAFDRLTISEIKLFDLD